VLDN
jgi:hypothetical protein